MPKRDNHNWGRYFGIGLEIALGVTLGYLAGRWLDLRFGWEPWATVVGAMLGLSAGLYLLLKEAVRMNKD